MARMNGAELGETLQKTRRDIRIMFMTGSLDGSLLVLNYGWAMIEKPFVAEKLLEMINVVLHSPNRSQGTHQYEAPEDTRTPE
jgi:FixJ family two-component response regulator